MKDKRVIVSIFLFIVGAVLITLSFAGKVDEFWNGLGSALAVVGALQILRFYRFNKNVAYREKIEIAENDERNQFISSKAWAWTGYLFLLIVGVSAIAFRIVGLDILCSAAAGAISLMIAIYWIVYLVLRRKY